MFKTPYLKQSPKPWGCGWWVWHMWGWLGILDGQRSADSHLYRPAPERGASICIFGCTAKCAEAQSHVHDSSFPLWVLQAHLHVFCGCFLHTYEPQMIKKSRQMVNALGGRKQCQFSLTYTIHLRTNDTVGLIFLWVSFLRENYVAWENGGVGNQQSGASTDIM